MLFPEGRQCQGGQDPGWLAMETPLWGQIYVQETCSILEDLQNEHLIQPDMVLSRPSAVLEEECPFSNTFILKDIIAVLLVASA